ncbi:MAG: hypothetical protein ABSB35_03020 [Bryobacteraceae bacterium]|jgi:hypothetical protein
MKTTQRSGKDKASPKPAEYDLDRVVGCLPATGKAKTLAQMDRAIQGEVIRRHCRGRY